MSYMLQTRDAIILRRKIRYLDLVAISLHAGPNWWKENDDTLNPYKTCKEKQNNTTNLTKRP